MEAKDFIESKKINFRCAEIQRFSNMETNELYKLEDLLNEFLKLNFQTGTKQPCFIHDVSTSILFHGSPIKINDRYMASETYFTEDIEIAKEYGNFVYSIEMDDKLRTIMQLDCLGEHFISTRLIPMYLFNVQEF